MTAARDDLADLLEDGGAAITQEMLRLARSLADHDAEEITAAERDLGEQLGRVMALADLVGRRRLALEVEAARRGMKRIGTATIALASVAVDGVAALGVDGYLQGCARAALDIGVRFGDVSFERAVQDLVARVPVLADPVLFALGETTPRYKVVQAIYQQHGFALARATTQQAAELVQDAIARVIRGAPREVAVEAVMREVEDATRAYAETVVRTNLTTAYAAGRLEQAANPALSDVVLGLRYVATPDRRVRPNHAANHGLTARHDDPIWTTHSPPMGYSCFPAGTVVEGRTVAALRVFYDGEIVEIRTKRGRVLRVTPNHPVATVDGFVAAGSLAKGQNLLCDARPVDGHLTEPGVATVDLPGPNEEHAPARIEEAFRALGEDAPILPGRLMPHDLHGDALFAQGEIEVVTLRGMLGVDGDTQQTQSVFKRALSDATARGALVVRARAQASLGLRDGPPARSRPSGAALALDSTAVEFQARPLQPLRFGATARLNARLAQPAGNNLALDAKFARELLHGGGGIAPDEIVMVRAKRWAGHVYDLQDERGWILANGIVTSNCRCALALATPFNTPRSLIGEDGRLVPAIAPPGGGADEGFWTSRPDAAIYGGRRLIPLRQFQTRR